MGNNMSINNTLKIIVLLMLGINSTTAATLPNDLEWLTNTTSTEWSSSAAKKGGLLRFSIPSFPVTLRTVGPSSSSYFRNFLLDNQMPLVSRHPNSGEIIPILASHWAYGDDGKTIYYKIKENARWSDGTPVTSDDFSFALEFNRSKYISAPWYNKYYSEKIISVIKFDSHTLAIVGAHAKPANDLHYYYNLKPRAKHFHKLDQYWVNKFNWKTEPNTGPYQISNIRKGKIIAFQRKSDWWGQNDRFLRNRFNVDRVLIKVVRNPNSAFKYFERGELDVFNLTSPKLWHKKANGPMFEKGFIHKLTYYNQIEHSASGLYLNLDNNILSDINVRRAIAHSLNFNKIIKQLLQGEYKRLNSFHDGYGKYSNQEVTALAFDLEQANEYLDSSGWANKDSLGIRIKDQKRLSLIVNYGNKIHQPQINALAKEAKKAGIELKPQYLESVSLYQHITEKKYDIAWLGYNSDFRPAYWQHFHSDNAYTLGSNNITNLASPYIDTLIDQYQLATKEEERIHLAHVLENEIAAQVVFIPSTVAPFTRTAFWRWFKLPATIATKTSESIFDPFHPTRGGLFWINSKQKIDSLSSQKSGEGFKASTVINTDYQ